MDCGPVRDSASVLPATCGEATDLPGVPGVGCVASVTYLPDSPDGFAACVTSSQDAVYVLGPNLDTCQRQQLLTTRQVWRPPAMDNIRGQRGGEPILPSSLGGPSPAAEYTGASVLALTAFLLHPDATRKAVSSTGGSSGNLLPLDTLGVVVAWGDGLGVHHVSFLAFSLSDALRPSVPASLLRCSCQLDALPLAPSQRVLRLFYHPAMANPTAEPPPRASVSTAGTVADTEETKQQQEAVASVEFNRVFRHVVLCSSYTYAKPLLGTEAGTDMGGGVIGTADQRVAPQVTSNPTGTTATATSGLDTANTMSRAMSQRTVGKLLHLVIRIQEPAQTTSATASNASSVTVELSTPEWRNGSFLDCSSSSSLVLLPAVFRGGGGGGGESHTSFTSAFSIGPPPPPLSALRDGEKKRKSATATTPNNSIVGGSSASDVAPWLARFQTDRVISVFAVQDGADGCTGGEADGVAVAAAGSLDGRVFVVTATGDRVVRRLVGPIADLTFVSTRTAPVNAHVRCSVVDELVEEAMQQQLKGSDLSTSPAECIASSSVLGGAGSSGADIAMALVVLDSVGRVVILRGINSATPTTQSVADIPQVITLAERHQSTLTFVDLPRPGLPPHPPVSSKSFLDLSSLRQFFHRRITVSRRDGAVPHSGAGSGSAGLGLPPRREGSGEVGAMTGGTRSGGSLVATPANDSLASRGGGDRQEDAHSMTGHVLSRGLLCVTSIEAARGRPELVVSTMGQAVVALPFDPVEGNFVITGFTVTPTPMHYVGFVDFFGCGTADLVMAGLQSVLVARRPRSSLREKALLVMRLLSRRGIVVRPKPASTGEILET